MLCEGRAIRHDPPLPLPPPPRGCPSLQQLCQPHPSLPGQAMFQKNPIVNGILIQVLPLLGPGWGVLGGVLMTCGLCPQGCGRPLCSDVRSSIVSQDGSQGVETPATSGPLGQSFWVKSNEHWCPVLPVPELSRSSLGPVQRSRCGWSTAGCWVAHSRQRARLTVTCTQRYLLVNARTSRQMTE